jgi:hypothetical protein
MKRKISLKELFVMKFYTPEEIVVLKKRKKIAMYAGIYALIILVSAGVSVLAYTL